MFEGRHTSSSENAEKSKTSDKVRKCWNDNPDIPIFERGRKLRYTAEEAVQIILQKITDRGLTCKLHPLRVRENATLCIDTGSYESWEDIEVHNTANCHAQSCSSII